MRLKVLAEIYTMHSFARLCTALQSQFLDTGAVLPGRDGDGSRPGQADAGGGGPGDLRRAVRDQRSATRCLPFFCALWTTGTSHQRITMLFEQK